MTATNEKADIQHVDHFDATADDWTEKEKQDLYNGRIDPETAKYLDPTLVDWRILPFLLLIYFCQTCMYHTTLAFSSIMGLQADTNLQGQQYSTLVTILYAGYLIGEIIIQKVPLGKFLGILVIIWGTIVCMHAVCKNFGGLMAVRFLLGFFESGVQPALRTLTTMYYRRNEHPTIISYWYGMQGVQLCVSGLIAFGLTYVNSPTIYTWQALFIIVGGFTVVVGVLTLIFLPDSPMKAKSWPDKQKTMIIERLRINEQGVQDSRWKWEQMWEAFQDPAVWCYWVMQTAGFVIVNGLAVFANIIVKRLGFTVRQTQLLNLAQGGFSLIIYFGTAWVARLTNQTCLVLAGTMAIALAGTVVLLTVPVSPKTAPGLLLAFYFANFVIAAGSLLYSIVTRNIAGQTKKACVSAMLFVAYGAGCIIGPQVFRAKDAPRYKFAFAVHIGLYAFFIVMTFILCIIFMRRNHIRRRDHEGTEQPGAEHIDHDQAFADLTDLQNKRAFRYVY
ncbi:hypothetical protein L486_01924 [Kwoniella mangroviensis CBS 10435]|uniref:Major facilitator superfamily (MFS) profile domain-containing protein n=1 Tax=Kwoniella mangroviensis CBS 10435 TaxID=1331196 RepID=A0A1B9J392_9TREE|nr:hypothetical protein L486_01924 [Kwoniella mangroviensis CBS 10435]